MKMNSIIPNRNLPLFKSKKEKPKKKSPSFKRKINELIYFRKWKPKERKYNNFSKITNNKNERKRNNRNRKWRRFWK